jgi:hypothetical protein
MENEIEVDDIVSILQRLVTLGRSGREEKVAQPSGDGSTGPRGPPGDISSAELQSVGGLLQDISSDLWGRTVEEGVSMADVARYARC